MKKNLAVAAILTFLSLQLFSSVFIRKSIERVKPSSLSDHSYQADQVIKKPFAWISYQNNSSYTVHVRIEGQTFENENYNNEFTLELGNNSLYVPDGVYALTFSSYYLEIKVKVDTASKVGMDDINFPSISVTSATSIHVQDN